MSPSHTQCAHTAVAERLVQSAEAEGTAKAPTKLHGMSSMSLYFYDDQWMVGSIGIELFPPSVCAYISGG